jgi:ABC-type phosphate transport system permease subunit
MQEHTKIETLTNGFKAYLNTNCELIKLQATEKSASIGSVIISKILIGVVAVLFVLFISLGFGFYLSAYFGNNYIGFAIVAGFYFVLGLVLVIARKGLIERPIRDKIIRKVFYKSAMEVA